MPSSYYGQDYQTDLDNIKLDALHLNSCPAEIIQQYLSPAGEEEEEEERGEQVMELELNRCSVIQNNVTVSITAPSTNMYITYIHFFYCIAQQKSKPGHYYRQIRVFHKNLNVQYVSGGAAEGGRGCWV